MSGSSNEGGDLPLPVVGDTVQHVPVNMQVIDLPPQRKDRYVEVMKPQVREVQIEVPQVQYIEKVEEVPRPVMMEKRVPMPKMELVERIVEIPKYVKNEKIVEVPQTQVIDNVEEVIQYIPQEKVVERQKIMLQERIIPIPRRTIEEKIVEVPAEEFAKILADCDEGQLIEEEEEDDTGYICGAEQGQTPRRYAKERKQALNKGPAVVKEIVEVPHVQHLYRNVMQPQYRHIPKPVEVPLTHYRPHPVERLVDRNVPIPVELEVVQEFLCPKIEAKYKEVPVPVCVTRSIEKPVPADAMFNSIIMEAYMNGHPEPKNSCLEYITGADKKKKQAEPMKEFELMSAGISTQPSFSQVKQFTSTGDMPMYNVQKTQDFLARARTIVKEGQYKF